MNSVKFVTKNRRARFDYLILEIYEAGIILVGSEVKSLREGKVSLAGCYGKEEKGEFFLYGLHIPPFEKSGSLVAEPSFPLRQTAREGVAVSTKSRPFRLPPKHFKGPNPERPRKLLLHREEIHRILGKINERGLTLIPLSLYFKKGILKVEVALCKGRRKYEKREKIRERETEREIRRIV